MRGILVRWLVSAAALWLTSSIVDGVQVRGLTALLLAAAMIGVINAVVRPVTPGAPVIRSFVYEATPTFEDMLDFHRFFGSGGDNAKLRENINRVNEHMSTFADTAGLQTTPMAEYIFKTFST